MSSNSRAKFSKLQLPRSARTRMQSNAQISKFFSQPDSNTDSTSASPIEQFVDETTSSWKSEEIILIVTDDEETDDNIPPQKTKSKIIESNGEIARKTTVSKFFEDNSLNDSDFVQSKVSEVKSSTQPLSKKLKTNSQPKSKPGSLGRRKRQTKIKTAFAKHEEMFSAVMAQHSIADEINPDELQLALAISLSEVEANGDEEPPQSTSSDSKNIRERLNHYGFRTGNNTDYELTYLLPKKKNKWHNKFTALTLRKAEKQQQKVDVKIEELLSELTPSNLDSRLDCSVANSSFSISSNFLRNFVPTFPSIKSADPIDSNEPKAETFYVTELFTPSKSKLGNLLKDFHKIPGRDLSPKSKNNRECRDKSFEEIDLESFQYQMQANREMEERPIDVIPNDNLDSPLHKKLKVMSPLPTPEKLPNIEFKEETGRVISPDIFAEYEMSTSEGESETSHRRASIENPQNLYNAEELRSEITRNSENLNNSNEYKSEKSVDPEKLNNSNEFTSEKSVDPEKLNNSNEFTSEKSVDHEKLNNSNEFTSEKSVDHEKLNNSVELRSEKSVDHEKLNNSVELRSEKSLNPENLNCSDEFKSEITLVEKFSSDEVKISGSFKKYCSSNSLQNSFDDNCTIDLTQDFDQENTQFELGISGQLKDMESIKNKTDQSYNSQISTAEDDDCIIILSDDEVNYSIQVADESRREKLKKIDLTVSSSSETEEGEFNMKKDLKNFSFIELIDENNDQNLLPNMKNILNIEKNENISYLEVLEENEQSQSQSIEVSPEKLNYSNKTFLSQTQNKTPEKDCFEFLSPSKMKFRAIKESKTSSIEDFKRQISDDFDDDMDFDLSKLRKIFGVTNELNYSTNRQGRESIRRKSCRKTLSESFVSTPNDKSLKRFSSSFKCNNELPNSMGQNEEEEDFSDTDEIDKLVYGSPLKKSNFRQPKDLDKLLTGNIANNSRKSVGSSSADDDTEERTEIVNDRKYIVRLKNIKKKPDFNRMDSPTRLNELHKVGLKPLKKKQAVIMLEYIYNQMHPFIMEMQDTQDNRTTELINDKECISNSLKYNNFKLVDCFGDILLENDGLRFGEVQNEMIFFQTNTTKKNYTALLPLHVAWYNLIKSSPMLREAILHYEPINLQEIYLFLKRIGYRYDPKDMKKFFDNRCIIFRYDLVGDTQKQNRHVRKTFKKTKSLSQRSQKVLT